MKIFTLLLALLLIALPARAAETVTVVADFWCPYNCEPGSEKPGIIIEITQRAFAKHGITLDYKLLPWARAIAETRDGTHSAIVGAAYGDAPDFIFPSEAQSQSHMTLFVKKGNPWRYDGLKSLYQVTLGSIVDYAYNDEINEYIDKNKDNPKLVQRVSGDNALAMNVKKLLKGRIGALIEGKSVMDYYLSTNSLSDQIEEAGALPVTEEQNLYIAFSPALPNSQKYADILAAETRAMRESGELEQIMQRYTVAPQNEEAP